MSAPHRREDELSRINQALARIAISSIRGRDLAREDLKWKTRVDLSSAALPILGHLSSSPMRLTDLAIALHVTGPAVSRQIQMLQAKGLVERTPDETDARAAIVALTPKGAEVVAEDQNSRMALLHRILESWSDHDLANLAPLLDRLAGELEKWDHR